MGNDLEAMPIRSAALYFGIPTLYFWLLTHLLIPYLNQTAGMHPAMSWFVTGFLIFIPLFCAAWFFVKKEGNAESARALFMRLRLKKFTSKDWIWAVGGLLATFISTGLILGISSILTNRFGTPPLKTTPDFMTFDRFMPGERWMLSVWLPMFFFNIVGEEIFWRGYILPRQELADGKRAWLVNAVLWGIFHVSFGADLLIMLIPVLIILPYAVSKTKNTSVGIFIHGVFNGPMFVLVSLGILK